jgi:hypothetical protein
MDSWHVDTISIIRDEDSIRTCPLHGTMLDVVRVRGTPLPVNGDTPCPLLSSPGWRKQRPRSH